LTASKKCSRIMATKKMQQYQVYMEEGVSALAIEIINESASLLETYKRTYTIPVRMPVSPPNWSGIVSGQALIDQLPPGPARDLSVAFPYDLLKSAGAVDRPSPENGCPTHAGASTRRVFDLCFDDTETVGLERRCEFSGRHLRQGCVRGGHGYTAGLSTVQRNEKAPRVWRGQVNGTKNTEVLTVPNAAVGYRAKPDAASRGAVVMSGPIAGFRPRRRPGAA
jgi:hypothetical protein